MLLHCVVIESLTHHAPQKETIRCFFFEIKPYYQPVDAAKGYSSLLEVNQKSSTFRVSKVGVRLVGTFLVFNIG